MASSATARLRLQKQATYDNPNSWGVELNQGALDMLDEAFGVVEVTVDSNVTLDVQNYITDESRAMVLILSGTGGFEVTAPAVDKPYLVLNDCAADVTMKPSGGTAATIRAGTGVWYATNAAGTAGRVNDPTLDKIKAPSGSVDINGQKLTNLADPTDAQDAATKNYIDTLAASGDLATVAAIADEIVTVADIQDGTVATDAVTDVAAIAAQVVLVASVDDAVAQLADMYVGASATAPTTRLDGSPLEAGDFYLNTSGTPTVNVYDGANWIPIEAVTIASQGEAEAGSNNTNVMTPLRTKQAIDAQRPVGSTGVSVTKTDTFSMSTTATWTDITGLEVTITPGSVSRRVLIAGMINVGQSATSSVQLRLLRDSTPIAFGDAEGSRTVVTAIGYPSSQNVTATVPLIALDEPATASPVTYKVQMRISTGDGYVNRAGTDTNNASTYRAASTLTATEYL